MATGDTFSWLGTQSDDWSTPSNWQNVTTGANPATGAPGPNDVAIFGSVETSATIAGTGAAAAAIFQSNEDVSGQFSIATLDAVDLDITGAITAVSADFAPIASLVSTGIPEAYPGASVSVDGPNASLSVAGDLNFDSARYLDFGYTSALSVTNQGNVHAGSASVSGVIVVDDTSSLTIGNVTTALAGGLTVGSGGILKTSNDATIASNVSIASNIRVQAGGLLAGRDLTLGGPVAFGPVVAPIGGTTTIATYPPDVAGNIVDDGTIAGSDLVFNGASGTLSGDGVVQAASGVTVLPGSPSVRAPSSSMNRSGLAAWTSATSAR